MFNFRESLKQRTSIELLNMLEHPEKFQPDAIAAAQEIIETRKKDAEEWPKVELQIAALHLSESPEKEEVHENIFDQVEHEKNIWIIKQIRIITASFLVYLILSDYNIVRILIETHFRFFSLSDPFHLLMIINILIIITGALLFYKREKSGWIILTFYATMGILNQSIHILKLLHHFINVNTDITSFISYYIILGIAFYFFSFYQLLKTRLREQLGITKEMLTYTITLAITLDISIMIASWINK